MKKKKQKINRYEYQWGGQRKLWWRKAATTALIVAAAAAVGWLVYEPVYSWITGIPQMIAPAPSSSLPAAPSESTPPPESSSAVVLPPKVDNTQFEAYYLPHELLTSPARLASELERIKAAGGTAVAFDLKDENGIVRYKSELTQVAQYLVQGENPYSLTDTIATIRLAGLIPVGRLFAFKDSKVTSAAAMNEGAVKYMNNKINWLDNSKANGGKAWLNPNSALARDYIALLADEVVSMGLDTVIMDGVQFPTGLSLNLATFGGEPDRSRVLADFLSDVAARVERKGGKLYPVIGLDSIVGLEKIKCGSDPQLVARAAGGCIIDVRPEQFGVGVTTDALVLTKPLQTPYESLTTALAAVETLLADEETSYGAMVQCYTSTKVESGANTSYGKAEVEAQVKAAREAGLENLLYYSPSGSYNY